MSIEYFYDIVQGSPEWYLVRLGIPSASHFGDVMAGGDGKVRDLYMRKLVGEIVSGLPREDFKNAATDRGTRMEPELRGLYEMISGNKTTPVGFVKSETAFGPIGCSPDSLVGEDGIVEFKSQAPHLLIETLERDRIPPEHLPQCYGSMLVTGRKWCDVAIGYSGMPLFRRRLLRDSAYLARLSVCLEQFRKELDARVERTKNYGRR